MNNIPIKLYKLQGRIQHYAWGGFEFLPALLQMDNVGHKPFAEYWMGAHQSAPSEIILATQPVALNEFINQSPVTFLGEITYQRFHQLPFLFKILDVHEVLSIQVHPSKTAAEAGFEKENAAGIPLNAQHRNYKDGNHKPEMMIALSDFWLLHGFLSEKKLKQVLQNIGAFNFLLPVFEEEGYYGLYKKVMEMDQYEVNETLSALVQNAVIDYEQGKLLPVDPAYWAAKAIFQNEKNIDRGIFSIYFFNIVHLKKGQGIFQGAGLPHAYLYGQNVELMANSDNVLRGGLTQKYIDVPELLQHINFEATIPKILNGRNSSAAAEKIYSCPVDDFGISKITLSGGETFAATTFSADILIVMEGNITANGSQIFSLQKGECMIAFSGEQYQIRADEDSVFYRAFVPVKAKS